ncbi:MAG TPA: thiol reductant ABC exporter subunit CydC [Bacillota bacterium]|nr:thiol reductant ABC exporter subunit CydC [Bacillota bacterium]
MRRWIYPYLKQFKTRNIIMILFGLLGIGSGAMLLFVSGFLISKTALQPENIMLVYVPIVSVRAFSIGQAVFLYLEKLTGHDVVLRILQKMRSRLYKIVEPQALSLRSRYQTGDLLGVLSDDIEHLQHLYLQTIFPSILGLFTYAIFIGVLGLFDGLFAFLMVLLLGVLVFLLPFISFITSRRDHVQEKQQKNTLYRQLTDAIFGQLDWRASGRTAEVLERFAAENDALLKTEHSLRKRRHWRDGVLRFVAGIALLVMIVWSDMQTGQGHFSPTVIAAFVLVTFSIIDALLPMSQAAADIPTYADSIKRLQAIESRSFDQPNQKDCDWQAAEKVTMTLHKVSYQYPNSSSKAIDRLSLHIPHGKKIAVLGKSGAGKSTLVKLMAGLVQPDEGKITLNEHPMDKSFLSTAVSVLNQKPHLFDTTIENNLRIGKPEASEEEIWHVVEQAQLTDLIASLPHGLQTNMHEMGKRFSGGERQRIAFARVLLQNTPIILFDEPTIGLDPVTEQNILETIFNATENKTVIWITHHLAGVENMDEIIFLNKGQIFMRGSHHKLLQTNKYYQTLYRMDQGVYETPHSIR